MRGPRMFASHGIGAGAASTYRAGRRGRGEHSSGGDRLSHVAERAAQSAGITVLAAAAELRFRRGATKRRRRRASGRGSCVLYRRAWSVPAGAQVWRDWCAKITRAACPGETRRRA
jgi:hypothetical protein